MVQAATVGQSFLVQFIQKQKYMSFCLPELESLAKMFGVPQSMLYAPNAG